MKKKKVQFAEPFEGDGHEFLLSSTCPVPLPKIVEAVETGQTADLFGQTSADHETTEAVVEALTKALNAETVVKRIDDGIVTSADDYRLFFKRIGQGGTALSDDELSYSLIKHLFPHVRDRVREIVTNPAVGRLIGPTDLVLGAMRVARIMARRELKSASVGTGRPDPNFVSRLGKDASPEEEHAAVKRHFLTLLPKEKPESAMEGDHLEAVLARLRTALRYETGENASGLPAILLSRMHRSLIDTLLLFATFPREGGWDTADRKVLRAYTLHALLFLDDQKKAANEAFHHAAQFNEQGEAYWGFTPDNVRKIVAEYEHQGIALTIPRLDDIQPLRGQIDKLGETLPSREDRYSAADTETYKPGNGLRALAHRQSRIKNALMWLQREYLQAKFGHYDPTSTRDEEMPLDLDHLIPQIYFDFSWGKNVAPRRLPNVTDRNNFRHRRNEIGNSLGNYRWLCGRINRTRKHGRIKEVGGNEDRFDLIGTVSAWNELIPETGTEQRWEPEDIGKVQRLIASRTLALYRNILEDGIAPILPPRPIASDSDDA